MTKLEFLISYITDDIIKEKDILSEDEVINFEWNNNNDKPLIYVLQLIINAIEEDQNVNVIVRKVNKYLDNNL